MPQPLFTYIVSIDAQSNPEHKVASNIPGPEINWLSQDHTVRKWEQEMRPKSYDSSLNRTILIGKGNIDPSLLKKACAIKTYAYCPFKF